MLMGGPVWGRRGRQIGGRRGENREGDREGGNGTQETKTCKTTNPEGHRTSDVDIKTELKSVSGAFQNVPLMSNTVTFFPPFFRWTYCVWKSEQNADLVLLRRIKI